MFYKIEHKNDEWLIRHLKDWCSLLLLFPTVVIVRSFGDLQRILHSNKTKWTAWIYLGTKLNISNIVDRWRQNMQRGKNAKQIENFFCKIMKFLSSKGREDGEIFWSKVGKDSGKEKVLRDNYLVSVGEGKSRRMMMKISWTRKSRCWHVSGKERGRMKVDTAVLWDLRYLQRTLS